MAGGDMTDDHGLVRAGWSDDQDGWHPLVVSSSVRHDPIQQPDDLGWALIEVIDEHTSPVAIPPAIGPTIHHRSEFRRSSCPYGRTALIVEGTQAAREPAHQSADRGGSQHPSPDRPTEAHTGEDQVAGLHPDAVRFEVCHGLSLHDVVDLLERVIVLTAAGYRWARSG